MERQKRLETVVPSASNEVSKFEGTYSEWATTYQGGDSDYQAAINNTVSSDVSQLLRFAPGFDETPRTTDERHDAAKKAFVRNGHKLSDKGFLSETAAYQQLIDCQIVPDDLTAQKVLNNTELIEFGSRSYELTKVYYKSLSGYQLRKLKQSASTVRENDVYEGRLSTGFSKKQRVQAALIAGAGMYALSMAPPIYLRVQSNVDEADACVNAVEKSSNPVRIDRLCSEKIKKDYEINLVPVTEQNGKVTTYTFSNAGKVEQNIQEDLDDVQNKALKFIGVFALVGVSIGATVGPTAFRMRRQVN